MLSNWVSRIPVKLVLALAGLLALAKLVHDDGGLRMSDDLRRAAWILPVTMAIHALQLFLSSMAWQRVIGESVVPQRRFFAIRMIREGVNSLLPVAQVGGPIVGVRLLVRSGLEAARAAGGTTLDITVEVASQLLFTLAGLVGLALLGGDADWLSWAVSGVAMSGLGLVGFVLAQRAGLLRLIEWASAKITRLRPDWDATGLRGLHQELMRLQQDRTAMLVALALQLVAWLLGCVEAYAILRAIGLSIGWLPVFVIESLGMAARSAGFAIPGSLGMQEGGLLLAGAAFGVSPDAALALSMLKRCREILIAVPAVAGWQWWEQRIRMAAIAPDRSC